MSDDMRPPYLCVSHQLTKFTLFGTACSIHKRGRPMSFPMFSFALNRKWDFKVKYKPSGQTDKYKYSDTCSPIIKSDSMRTMFATTGDGDYYVGFEVINCKEAGIIFLHQTRYINEVLD